MLSSKCKQSAIGLSTGDRLIHCNTKDRGVQFYVLTILSTCVKKVDSVTQRHSEVRDALGDLAAIVFKD